MRTLALALLLSLAALAPSPASGGADPDDAEAWPTPPARGGDGWSQADREELLAACRGWGPEPFCHCWLAALEPRYPSLLAFAREATRKGKAAFDVDLKRCWLRHGGGR
jgi:hypothetical protein